MDERAEPFLVHAFNTAIVFLIASATFFVLWHLVSLQPTGHDEAVYLTKARSWIEGTPANQWAIYRPIGMSVVGWLVLHFGESERVIRTFGIISGMFACGIIFLFFRKLTNLWVALVVTTIVATSYLFLQQAPQFLNDISSSALLIALLFTIFAYYRSRGGSNVIYLAAPLSAVAFYLRYGIVPALTMIGFWTAVLLAPRVLREKDMRLDKFLITGAIIVALFAPHFLYSLSKTKSILGILASARNVANLGYFGEGLVQYIHWLPDQIAGWPFGIAAIIGAAATVAFLVIRPMREKYTGLAWIGAIGFSTFVLTGLFAHAEQRYVFFPMVLLAGVGVASVYYAVAFFSEMIANMLAVLCVAGVLAVGVHHYQDLDTFFRSRENNPTTIAYGQTYEAIRKDAVGKSGCSIWLVQFLPSTAWYTGCSVYSITTKNKFNTDFSASADDIHYSVVVTKLKNSQIDEKTANSFGVSISEIYRLSNLPAGEIIVYRIAKGASSTISTSTTNASSPTATTTVATSTQIMQ